MDVAAECETTLHYLYENSEHDFVLQDSAEYKDWQLFWKRMRDNPAKCGYPRLKILRGVWLL
jgi:hypothetical protein